MGAAFSFPTPSRASTDRPKDVLFSRHELAQNSAARCRVQRMIQKTTKDGAAMKNPLIFSSACSSCGQQRLQYGYTHRALTKLIESRQTIDAYCLECDVVWAITTEERALIASAVAARQSTPGPRYVTDRIDTMQQQQEGAHR
jgi:hypothetical protein